MFEQSNPIQSVFGPQGLLSKGIPNYLPRAVQIEMATAVTLALESRQILMVEAGTGTGKTYAYLVPSMLSGKKVIISTGTKNLQDQLYYRDIPLIRQMLGVPLKIVILKGRSNYLCHQRLSAYMQTRFITKESLALLTHIKRWADGSLNGELEQFEGRTPDSHLLPYITSTTDNCLGQECEFYSSCFVMKARRLAQDADVLIINHHLFFADTHLKETGIFELLPDADAIIFDEAHQLPEIATHFLGESISGRQLAYLARDIEAEQMLGASDFPILKEQAALLSEAVKVLRLAFGKQARGSWEWIVYKPEIQKAINALKELLLSLSQYLEQVEDRSKGLASCAKRLIKLRNLFTHLTSAAPKNQIHWYECENNNFSLRHTPLDIAVHFQRLLAGKKRAWIFTSATLSVKGNFSHFENCLGLNGNTTLHLESPFDYNKQALLYLPRIKVDPSHEDYILKVMEYAIPLLQETKGRAFFLFTSYKALNQSIEYLAARLNFPLLIQGTLPKSQLLTEFSCLSNAILLGTSSFWEGVDVKGDCLSCVIIDKIPFLAPDDPVLKARMDYYRRQDKNVFQEIQLPQAVIALRQGAGRLIRDISDKGVLMICDPRMKTRDYGQTLLEALPPMRTTDSFQAVIDFLGQWVDLA